MVKSKSKRKSSKWAIGAIIAIVLVVAWFGYNYYQKNILPPYAALTVVDAGGQTLKTGLFSCEASVVGSVRNTGTADSADGKITCFMFAKNRNTIGQVEGPIAVAAGARANFDLRQDVSCFKTIDLVECSVTCSNCK